nr:hypothetical protein [Verrucomicrobium spinosum]
MLDDLCGHGKGLQNRGILWFFNKVSDPAIGIRLHDAEGLRLPLVHRNGGDGDVGIVLQVAGQDLAKIHPVQLVTA